MALKWIIAGGGTGGHVTMALALGEVISERGDDVLFIGSDAGLEARLVPEAGFDLVALPSRQVMGRGPMGKALGVAGILRASLEARSVISRFGADLVLSVGGYASLPAALAAAATRRPLALIEPNAIPGRSNRMAARFATRVYTGFEDAARRLDPRYGQGPPGTVRCAGVPLRPALVEDFRNAAPRPAPNPPFHLLVFGGSQGAKQINDALIEAAPRLSSLPIHIFHQTGSNDRQRVADGYARAGVEATVVEFESDMSRRYRWAHLAISRAGALSVAELTLVGLPALLVPYPWAADDHQVANAAELESAGAARRLQAEEDHYLSGEAVANAVFECFAAPETLATMSCAAMKRARPRAALEIVEDFAAAVDRRS